MAGNEGLLELNGKDIVQVIGEEAIPRSGDIDATTYNQKNFTISGSSYTITKDTPDVLYLELTGNFTFTCTGAANTNRTIKVQIHKASTVSAVTTVSWNGITEWLTDGNAAPVFGQVASTEQNLVVAICLSNTVVLGNTLYNSENPVSGGAVSIANVSGLQDALDAKLDSSALASYLPLSGGTVTGNLAVNGTITGTLNGNATTATNANHATTADTATDNTKIRLTGARGQLAGYEACSTVTSLTLTDTSADSNNYNSTSAITVNDGTAGMCWTKTIKLSQVPSAVNFGSNWNWVGGSAPSMVTNGLLVCTWQNNHGLINFLSPSA